MELEKELKARIFLHKAVIVKGALAHAYIVGEKKKGGLMLSEPCLEQNALDFADVAFTGVLAKGELDEAYNRAWELIKDSMPDNYRINITDL